MRQSSAYQQFKKRTQEIFNFAVLITISVPVLKQNLKLYSDGKIGRLPDPDYFEPSVVYEIKQDTIDFLKEQNITQDKLDKIILLKDLPFNNAEFKSKVIDAIGEDHYKANRNAIKKQSKVYIDNITNCTSNYQQKLATYLYFSTFSYFEAFIFDISKEVIDDYNAIDRVKYVNDLTQNHDIYSSMIKLDKKFDASKKDRYRKFSSEIRTAGYINPARLLFYSILETYKNKFENLKANEIPAFLEKTFMFKMTKAEIDFFHTIRDNRNAIGHGAKSFTPNLNDVIKTNEFLKSLSGRIDKHITFYFFKLKNYVE